MMDEEAILYHIERRVNDLVGSVDNHILNNHAKNYDEYTLMMGKRQALVSVLVELADIKQKHVER